MLPGGLAVECFYVISGFYMALVLEQKYSRNTLVFFFNRISRLYPGFLALTAFAILISNMLKWRSSGWGVTYGDAWLTIANFWPHFSPWSRVITIASNLMIEGKDFTLFMFADSNLVARYHLSLNPSLDMKSLPGAAPAGAFQFLPQAWSFGLEFNFYILSPFFARMRSRWIFLIMALSVSVRLLLAHAGYSASPWDYRFFPSELALFLLGLMAYRFYRIQSSPDTNWRRISHFATAVIVPLIAFSQYIPLGGELKRWATLLLLALAIPWIFERCKDMAVDRSIGELSYTMYLGHLVAFELLLGIGLGGGYWGSVEAILATVALSLLVRHVVERPADRWRHRLSRPFLEAGHSPKDAGS
jgi:peptidoglycan/LPS O-acetylase OafA/YrhL